MGLVTVPQCDVFGTLKTPIHNYQITVKRFISHGKGEDVSMDMVFGVDKYLSNRGLDRLLAFVERGTTPPKKKFMGFPIKQMEQPAKEAGALKT